MFPLKMLKLHGLLQRQASPALLQKCTCLTKPDDTKKTKMPSELTKLTDLTSKEMSKLELGTKEDMEWRTPWHQKEGQYYSMLRTFYTEENNVNIMKFIQQPVDLSPAAIKKWWTNRKEVRDIALQQYIPERNQMLGNELAAAHFLVHRGASVKFFGEEKWIKADEYNNYRLPREYEDDMFLQAIDCHDLDLHYEGLVNLRDLRQVEWLSLNGCEKLDDWGLDRASCLFMHSLLYLDLRNMPLITYRGLGALYKMEKLKILYVDDEYVSPEFEMTCLMLQEIKPDLDIRTGEFA